MVGDTFPMQIAQSAFENKRLLFVDGGVTPAIKEESVNGKVHLKFQTRCDHLYCEEYLAFRPTSSAAANCPVIHVPLNLLGCQA
jgi:hypothetical protein